MNWEKKKRNEQLQQKGHTQKVFSSTPFRVWDFYLSTVQLGFYSVYKRVMATIYSDRQVAGIYTSQGGNCRNKWLVFVTRLFQIDGFS